MSSGNAMTPVAIGQQSLKGLGNKEVSLPNENVCTNDACFSRGEVVNLHSKFCSECGKKLELRIADMFILLKINKKSGSFSLGSPIFPEDPEYPQDPDTPQRPNNYIITKVGMREFIRVIKKYEEEVFVEDI